MLFQCAMYYAFCREAGLKFMPLDVKKLTNLYPKLAKFYPTICAKIIFPLIAIIIKAVSRLGIIKIHEAKKETDLNTLTASETGCKTKVVWGWEYRCPMLMKKYRDEIRSLFKTPLALSSGLPGDNALGIHIRRGDYESYENGRYYYTDAQYLAVIDSLSRFLSDSIGSIIVFTNDPNINKDIYLKNRPNLVFSDESDYRLDHEKMALCRYLAGPPSTFTQWASYIGSVPLYIIDDPAKIPSLEDFIVCLGPC